MQKAKKIHGNEFEYIELVPTERRTMIKLRCKKHNLIFIQAPFAHLMGHGCLRCKGEKISESKYQGKTVFLKRAKETHGNKYDYSKAKCKGICDEVIIGCPIHGDFTQRGITHIHGSGCPTCGRDRTTTARTLTQEEFLSRAKEIHENKYNYEKVIYKNSREYVTIICPTHGEFQKWPSNHLNGQGCPKCGWEQSSLKQKYTTPELVLLAKEIHGDKYGYNKVDYKGSQINITLTCPIHGDFLTIPANHLQGSGCPNCKGTAISEAKSYTKEEYIEHAKAVHGDKYNYDNLKIISNDIDYRKTVVIQCPEHGEFTQDYSSHLAGCGCDKCGGSYQLTTEDFIKRATLIHGDRYDYSKSIYTTTHALVKIICKIPSHGEFLQRAYNHMDGRGCPKCATLVRTFFNTQPDAIMKRIMAVQMHFEDKKQDKL